MKELIENGIYSMFRSRNISSLPKSVIFSNGGQFQLEFNN